MNKKTIIIIILAIITLLTLFFFVAKRNSFFFFNNNINPANNWFQDLQKENGKFISDDSKISFDYPTNMRLERKNNETTFWDIQNVGGHMKEIATYGFEFTEQRQGNINELYKENIFYKENEKNFYGEKEISVSGYPAKLYNFCDTDNCPEKNMIREIFIEHDNVIYSFRFGSFSSNLQQKVLNSVKFNKKSDESDCSNDLDCKFIYTKMEYSCPSCKYSSDDWICMEKKIAENWWAEWSRQHSNIQCEMCLESESEYKMFECKCQNNKCIKNRSF